MVCVSLKSKRDMFTPGRTFGLCGCGSPRVHSRTESMSTGDLARENCRPTAQLLVLTPPPISALPPELHDSLTNHESRASPYHSLSPAIPFISNRPLPFTISSRSFIPTSASSLLHAPAPSRVSASLPSASNPV